MVGDRSREQIGYCVRRLRTAVISFTPILLYIQRPADLGCGVRVLALEYRLEGNSMRTGCRSVRLFQYLTLRSRARAPTWLALAGLLLAGSALPLKAQDLGPLRQITGPSPFSTCTADDVAGQ